MTEKKQSKFSKLLGDPRGYFFQKSSQWSSLFYRKWCSLYVYLWGRLKGVEFNGFPDCWGCLYLVRHPFSTIRIGRNFKANSSFKSNHIGMFTRSRITTNAKDAVVEIGDHVGISAATISAFQKISIGDYTLIGGNVLITDSDWHAVDPAERMADSPNVKTAEIKIGKNVFIGTRAVILKGTVIGDHSVIGAGSVVSGVIPPNVIACGNPCVVVKKIEPCFVV